MSKGFVTPAMRFGIGYHDKLGRFCCLACTVSVELAKAIATAMANDLNLAEYYMPRQRPVIWVYDSDGRTYGSF